MLILFSVSFADAQDLIVRSEGDSINCRITSEDSLHIYFSFVKNRKRSGTWIRKTDVLLLNYGYYRQSGHLTREKSTLNLNLGAGYLTGKSIEGLSSSQEEYLRELRSGITFGVDMIFYPVRSFGFGIDYNLFHTQNSIANNISDNININYFGVTTLVQSIFANDKGHFFYSITAGYVTYKNDADFHSAAVKFSGHTICPKFQTGMDLMITPSTGIGFNVAYILGAIRKIKTNNVFINMNEPENISRIECTAAIKFYSR
jgi:hypothetical protein